MKEEKLYDLHFENYKSGKYYRGFEMTISEMWSIYDGIFGGYGVKECEMYIKIKLSKTNKSEHNGN